MKSRLIARAASLLEHNRKQVFLAAAFAFLLLLFWRGLAFIVFSAILIAGNVMVNYYKRRARLPLELELVTFGTIIISASSGAVAGIVFAICALIITGIATADFSVFTLVSLAVFPLIAVLSTNAPASNIVAWGLIITLAKNIIIFMLYQLVLGYNLAMNLSFSISNIIVNLILFIRLGSPVIGLLHR